jgi:hypothetical protein
MHLPIEVPLFGFLGDVFGLRRCREAASGLKHGIALGEKNTQEQQTAAPPLGFLVVIRYKM